jgi:hypothetical protein
MKWDGPQWKIIFHPTHHPPSLRGGGCWLTLVGAVVSGSVHVVHSDPLSEWTSIHQPTMQDGWCMDRKYFFIAFLGPVHNHSWCQCINSYPSSTYLVVIRSWFATPIRTDIGAWEKSTFSSSSAFWDPYLRPISQYHNTLAYLAHECWINNLT